MSWHEADGPRALFSVFVAEAWRGGAPTLNSATDCPILIDRFRIAQYGGRYLVRGGRHEVVEGDWRPARLVVIEFPSVAQAKRWYDSPEYAPLKAIRQRTARTNGVLVEGA